MRTNWLDLLLDNLNPTHGSLHQYWGLSRYSFIEYLNIFIPSAMDELPIEQLCSQPVNPSHVTINGLSHYCTHNASVNNSI